MRKKVRK